MKALFFIIVNCEDLYEINTTVQSILDEDIRLSDIRILIHRANKRIKILKQKLTIINCIDLNNIFDCLQQAMDIAAEENFAQIILLRPSEQWLPGGIETLSQHYSCTNKVVIANAIHKSNFMTYRDRPRQKYNASFVDVEDIYGAIIATDLKIKPFRENASKIQFKVSENSKSFSIVKSAVPNMIKYEHNQINIRIIEIMINYFQFKIIDILVPKLKTSSLKVKINFKKIVIWKVILLVTSKQQFRLNKRICLSLNFKASEYKNLRKFASATRTPFFYTSIMSLNFYKRNQIFIDAETNDELIGAILYGLLRKIKYVYVGLPGARGIKQFLNYQTYSRTVHVSHGRNNSNKFNVYTDAAILKSNENGYLVNARRQFINNRELEITFQEGILIWFHGFRKGKSYTITQLLKDLRKLKTYQKTHQVIVFPHPTAKFFNIFLKLHDTHVYNPYLNLSLSCERIVCSSPTMYEIIASKRIDNKIIIQRDE